MSNFPLRPIDTFGILGAGTLGYRIGLQAALSGFQVLMCDVSQSQLAEAAKFQGQILQRLAKREVITSAAAEHALARIRTTTDPLRLAAEVDFVSESVTEDLALKQRVWESLAGKWREAAVLTTNTSYLLPSQMAAQSGDEARFCAFHFHDVFEARVVDVMPHPGTDAGVVEFLLELGRKLNQVPVHVATETSGYLFNHMLMAYLGAAGQLLAEGKSTAEDIDRSWMGNMGTRVGPFGMLDQIGLDTVDKILSVRSDRRSMAFRSVIAPLLEQGYTGAKAGRGFYHYPKPAYATASFLR